MANTELIRIASLSEAERKIVTGFLSTEERKQVLIQAARRKQRQNEAELKKERQNMSLADALAETGIAETYWDGKTISVRDDENANYEDVYTLSIAEGQMPPFFQKECKTLDEVEAELKDSHFPNQVFTDWSAVEPD